VVAHPPAGAVYVNVILQPDPGQLDIVPQTTVFPSVLLLMRTSTPWAPVLHLS
jgi:hypothetical protein